MEGILAHTSFSCLNKPADAAHIQFKTASQCADATCRTEQLQYPAILFLPIVFTVYYSYYDSKNLEIKGLKRKKPLPKKY